MQIIRSIGLSRISNSLFSINIDDDAVRLIMNRCNDITRQEYRITRLEKISLIFYASMKELWRKES